MTIVDAIAQSRWLHGDGAQEHGQGDAPGRWLKQTFKLPVEMIGEGERPTFPMMPGDEVYVPERPW